MAVDARLALALAVVVVAGVLKGSLGFGAPLVAVPLLAALVGARAAVVLVSLPLLAANAAVLLGRPVDRAAVRRFAPLLATLVPLTALGGVLLAQVPVAPSRSPSGSSRSRSRPCRPPACGPRSRRGRRGPCRRWWGRRRAC